MVILPNRMNRLTENHFAFKCPMNFDEMAATENGRFCKKCRKEVFDLTNCSIDEVIALQRKHGPICGSIKVAQAAAVALSLSASSCRMMGPPNPPPNTGDKTIDRNTIDGVILPPEQLEKLKNSK